MSSHYSQCLAITAFLSILVGGVSQNRAFDTPSHQSTESADGAEDRKDVGLDIRRFKELRARLDGLSKSRDLKDVVEFEEIYWELESIRIVAGTNGADGSPSQRQMKGRLLLALLSAISTRIDPDFQPGQNLPFWNVPPPRGSNVTQPGVSPDAITDPILRAEYEEAIRLNSEKRLQGSLQISLRRLRDAYPKVHMFGFVGRYYDHGNDEDREELRRMLEEEVKDEQVRSWLQSELEKLNKKFYIQPNGAIIQRSTPLP